MKRDDEDISRGGKIGIGFLSYLFRIRIVSSGCVNKFGIWKCEASADFSIFINL